jgi:sugar/nucleoside kinase (ribokinase family)
VLVDVNWRPVFWDDNGEAKREILAFLDAADIVKISDADLEFLYDMQFVTALLNPCSVRRRLLLKPVIASMVRTSCVLCDSVVCDLRSCAVAVLC